MGNSRDKFIAVNYEILHVLHMRVYIAKFV